MGELPLVIAVDCDDVLVPAGQKTIDIYNATYGTNVSLADLYDSPPEVWGVETVDEVLQRFDTSLQSNAGEFLQPFPEAIAAISSLVRSRQYELHLVTGRRNFLEPITRQMLEEFFPGCFQTVEHTNHYAPSGDTGSRRSKGEVCRKIGAHILIDDHLGHAKSAVDSGVKAILFGNYPWNQLEDLPAGLIRCRDWVDVAEVVSEMKQSIGVLSHG